VTTGQCEARTCRHAVLSFSVKRRGSLGRRQKKERCLRHAGSREARSQVTVGPDLVVCNLMFRAAGSPSAQQQQITSSVVLLHRSSYSTYYHACQKKE
jgi:hypothetical protein